MLQQIIEPEVYDKVLEAAKRKQALHISLGYEEADSESYLEEMIEDQYKAMAFSKITIGMCLALAEMEKEHPENFQSALNN